MPCARRSCLLDVTPHPTERRPRAAATHRRSHAHVPAALRGAASVAQKLPYIVSRSKGDRLIILPDEEADGSTSAGRPIGSEFYEVSRKLAFMDRHNIAVSVVSSANPWIDFVEADEAPALATQLNEIGEDLRRLERPAVRLRRAAAAAAGDLRRRAEASGGLPHMRGIIIGSAGRGQGLDDPAFEPIWKAAPTSACSCSSIRTTASGTSSFPDTGHAMMLAMGFTFETSIAVARLILRGAPRTSSRTQAADRPCGGTLPYLAGRLDSCVKNDISKDFGLPKPPSHYLKQCWLRFDRLPSAGAGRADGLRRSAKIMFGTDHPFFRRMSATRFWTRPPGRWPRRMSRRWLRSPKPSRRRSPMRTASGLSGSNCPRREARRPSWSRRFGGLESAAGT